MTRKLAAGDGAAAAAGGDRPRSFGRLEALLSAGKFVVTAETTPPMSADPAAVLARVGVLAGHADAVNVTDGARARAHLSSLATAAILARAGIEPVLQMTVRDRNRLALEGDLLGAAALGIPNILCLHGDDIGAGDQAEARAVHDLSSRGLIRVAYQMREQGALPSGRKIEAPPRLLIGAADTPRDPDHDWNDQSLREKVRAGVDFFQTQFCFDAQLVARYLARIEELGLLERARFLIGVVVLDSARSARWMNRTLWGVDIPDTVIGRMEAAANQADEGKTIALEMIQALRAVPKVAGVHIMAPGREAAIAEIIAESAILRARD